MKTALKAIHGALASKEGQSGSNQSIPHVLHLSSRVGDGRKQTDIVILSPFDSRRVVRKISPNHASLSSRFGKK